MKKVFGQELRRLRGVHGLTMKDLAEAIGCSIVYISDIERSKRNPPKPSDIKKILLRIGVPEALPEMLRLAVEAKRSVVFELDELVQKDDINLLLAFKRRIDQGNLSAEESKLIQDILDERTEPD